MCVLKLGIEPYQPLFCRCAEGACCLTDISDRPDRPRTPAADASPTADSQKTAGVKPDGPPSDTLPATSAGTGISGADSSSTVGEVLTCPLTQRYLTMARQKP